MKLDTYNNPIYETSDLIKLLYSGNGNRLEDLVVSNCPEVHQLAEHAMLDLKIHCEDQPVSIEQYDAVAQNNWMMPDEYRAFDPLNYCLNCATTQEEINRIHQEYAIFEQKQMVTLLKVLKYLVDTFRQHNVVWGVGRGSSVSSYILFLLGVHKIDSIKYNLDYTEFLR